MCNVLNSHYCTLFFCGDQGIEQYLSHDASGKNLLLLLLILEVLIVFSSVLIHNILKHAMLRNQTLHFHRIVIKHLLPMIWGLIL